MNSRWAVQLPAAEAGTLARLRSTPGLEICLQDDSAWLRGRESDEDLDARLRSLPGTRFEVLPDRQLIPAGCRVPRGYLPEGSWIALSEALRVEIEAPAFAAVNGGKVSVQVVRGGPVRDPNLLLTTLEAWAAYAETAPQIRLERLAFALNQDRQILLRGTPLPPLPGRRFVEEKGIAVPAGWTWRPPVDADVLRSVLQLNSNDLALLHEDGTWDLLRDDDLVRASRSAVRLSREGAAHA